MTVAGRAHEAAALMRGVTREHLRQGAVSVTDQVLLSATTFLIGIALATRVSQQVYGAYALGFAILLVVQGIQGALLVVPLSILAAPREGEDLRRFVSAAGIAQIGFGAITTALCLIVGVAGRVLAPGSQLPPVLLGLAAANFFLQVQAFVRRLLYTRLLPGRALVNDIVLCSIELAGLAGLWLLERQAGGGRGTWLCGRNVFLVMAVAAFVASALGMIQARAFFVTRVPAGVPGLLSEVWEMGRYGLGGQVGQAMFLLANRLAAAIVGGTAGVAMLEAPRLLVAPLQIVGASAGNLTIPRAARSWASGGRAGLLRFLTPVAVAWMLAFAGYATIVAAAPSFWLRLFYGSKYAGTEPILVLWCATYALLGLRVLPLTALRVTRRYSVTMWASIAGGVTVLLSAAALSAWLGVVGAAIGRLVGEVVLIAILVSAFVAWMRSETSEP
jgi:O-antigen/teichoic acid export membrane protein